MENIEEKLERLKVMIEIIELKIHRKLIAKDHEKELTLTHINRN